VPLGPAIAAGAIAGALAGCLADLRPIDGLSATILALSLLLVARSQTWRRCLVVLAVSGVTIFEGASARAGALDPPLAQFVRQHLGDDAVRVPVALVGRLARDAEPADTGVGLLVDVREIGDAHGLHAARGRVQAYVTGALAGPAARGWRAGRPVRLRATLHEPRVLQNPGGPSARWQALRRRYVLTASVKSGLLVDVGRGPAWREATAAVRTRVRDAVARHIAPRDSQSAAVVSAILIGDRAGLSPEVERRLQVAGTYHVIAISGGNVALLTVLCFGALRAAIRSRRLVSVLTIAAVVAYGCTVAGDPSVLRAVTAACLVLVAHGLGLAPQPVHLVATAAALLAVANPLIVIDVGAWLSFGATLGIVIGAGPLVRRAIAHGPRQTPIVTRIVLAPPAALLAATVCAEVAVLPVQAGVFQRVGLAGLFLNFIAVPAMAGVQIGGLATVAASVVSTRAADAAGAAAHLCASALIGSARLVDHVPWLSSTVPPTPLIWTVAYYACLVTALAKGLARPWRRLAVASTVVAAALITTAPTLERAAPPPGVLRVTIIDIGQGDAILVQFPDRHALLVDAGGTAGAFDVGRWIVVPAARALGIRRLDWLLVTHPDLDHIGGSRAVVDDLRPRELWEGVAVPPSRPRAELIRSAQRLDLVWRTVRAGDRLDLGGVALEVLHPPEPDWERRDVRNEDSVVLRMRYGDAELLLTGDAGVEFESGWSAPEGTGPFRLLKAGHHGSRSSSSERFVERYAPDVVLVSAGRANLFGHPHPDVVARFHRVGAALFRTDLDGAIIVETDGRQVDVRAMSGRAFRLGRLPEPF